LILVGRAESGLAKSIAGASAIFPSESAERMPHIGVVIRPVKDESEIVTMDKVIETVDKAIREQLRVFIYKNFILGQDFVLDDADSFLARGVIDSMGVLELVAFLQEAYGITVENEELIPDNLDTLENLSAYVSRKLDSAALENPGAGLAEGV